MLKKLATMKPTARIINTSRGGVIDEEALYDAISKRWQVWVVQLWMYLKQNLPTGNKLAEPTDNVISNSTYWSS